MPFTLADLVAVRALDLTVLSGEDHLDRPVQWVHVSDLEDPTPYLEGGELLMTVGLWLTGGADAEEYVRRLDRAGVVGLAFGVAPAHDAVPESLVAAARRHDFALVAVPRPTPFIAVSKAISQALAAEQYEEITRGFRQQQRLTSAAVGEAGAAGVVRLLAEELGGWVLLLDAGGGVRAAHPPAPEQRVRALAPHAERLRRVTAPASVSLADATEQVLLLPLLADRRVRGHLAVGTPTRLPAGQRSLINAAAALLTLVLEQGSALRAAEQRLRGAVLRLLLEPEGTAGRSPARELWPELPADPVVVAVAAGGPRGHDELAAALENSGPGDEPVFAADDEQGNLVAVVAAGGPAHRRLREVATTVPGLRVGESSPGVLADLPAAHREARQALAAGVRLGRRHTTHGDVGGSGLLALVGDADGRAFAESVLGPLRRHDAEGRGELLPSLRAWLEHNGHWDSAAAALGVHRHTLRHRTRRIEELLGRDLGAAGVRAELWTALQLLDATARS